MQAADFYPVNDYKSADPTSKLMQSGYNKGTHAVLDAHRKLMTSTTTSR